MVVKPSNSNAAADWQIKQAGSCFPANGYAHMDSEVRREVGRTQTSES